MVCPLCGNNKKVLVYNKLRGNNKFKLDLCSSCGLYYLNPFPTKKEINSFYGANYYYDSYVNDGVFAKKSLLFFESIKKYLPKKGISLDVGCSKGFLAYFFKRNGFDAYGIDLSKNACVYAKKIGVKAFPLDLLSFNFNKKFDVITLIDLLEHVDNPIKLLKKANSLLNDNGVIIISTPNIKSFYSKLSKDNWVGFDLPFHLTYFSKDSILFALKNAGFDNNLVTTDSFNLISIEGLLRTNLNFFFGKILDYVGLRKSFRKTFMLPDVKLKASNKIINLDISINFGDVLKKLINFPLNLVSNHLLLGDQLLSISKKTIK